MTREEKILLAIEKGITCNPDTGQIFGIRGKEIKTKALGYTSISILDGGKPIRIQSHQFIWYWTNKEVVDCIDHINRIKDDNRISNLRSVTLSVNQHNRNDKGYSWNKASQKWRAYIKISGKQINLGLYENEIDAKQAYFDGKKIYHIL